MKRALVGVELVLAAALVVFVAIGVVRARDVSTGRGFQVDEVEHIHAAYNLRTGKLIYRDFWEPHNPLLHFALTPVVNPADPVASFRRARALAFAVLLGTVALAFACAWRLSGRWSAGAAAAGLLIAYTTFVERGMEVRPDGGMALFILAALLAYATDLPLRRRHCLQAAALSAAFLMSQKAVFACVAFGCLWLHAALRERRPSLVLAPVGVWLAPVAVMFVAFAALGNLGDYWQYNVSDLLAAAQREGGLGFGPWKHLSREIARNPVVVGCALAGLGYCLGRGEGGRTGPVFPAVLLALVILLGRELVFPVGLLAAGAVAATAIAVRRVEEGDGGDRDRTRLFFPAVLGLVALESLRLNPFPYPYLHVTVVPILAVLGGIAITAVPTWHGWTRHRVACALVAAVAVAFALADSRDRLAKKAKPTATRQLQILRELDRVLEPNDPVFDMVGLYFQPDGFDAYTLTHAGYRQYRDGKFDRMIDAWRARGVVAIVQSYRTNWIRDPEQSFIRAHYVRYADNILLHGRSLDGLAPGSQRGFEVLSEREFRYDGEGAIAVDGQPFTRGVLSRGNHIVTTDQRISHGRLIMATPPPHPPKPGKKRKLYPSFD